MANEQRSGAIGLSQKDYEAFERIVYKSADDIAVSIARSFERLEERVDATESRLYSRISEVEDKIEASRQEIAANMDSFRSALNG